MKNIRKYTGILLLIIPFTGLAQQDSTITYQEAIAIALKNNYDIQVATNNVTIGKKQDTYGAAGFLPRVDAQATGGVSNADIHQEFSTNTSVNRPNVESNNLTAGVYLTWTVFDGLRMFATKERLDQLEEQGEISLKIQIENTIEQVTLSYYQVVMQEQLIKGINAAKAVSEERIKIADKKLSIGSGSNVDLLQAKLDLNEQKSNLLTQQAYLSEYKSNLLTLLRIDPFTTGVAVDSNFTFDKIRSVDEIRQNIEKQNNSIKYAQKNVNISSQVIKEVRSQALPRLALTGSYVFGRNESAAGLTLLNQSLGYNAGFTFTWNLYNGWNTHNQIQVAEIQTQNNVLYLESTKLNMLSTANIAYQRWLGYKQILDLEEDNIKVAEESLKITTQRLSIGLGSSIEVIESQQSYEDAITRLVNARYNVKAAEINMKKLMGELVK